MKLTLKNMEEVIAEAFEVDIGSFKFSKAGDTYKAFSETCLVNTEVSKGDPNWRNTLISHVKWQLYL